MVKVRKDLTGQKFGSLTVVKQVEDYVSPGGYKEDRWQCVCDCGNIEIVKGGRLRAGKRLCCRECANKHGGDIRQQHNDLTGQRFGKLVVLNFYDIYETPGGARETRWLCQCDCGNTTVVRRNKLIKGRTKSCGCYRSEVTSERFSIDLKGQKYGMLTPIECVGSQFINGKNVGHLWRCRCDCGNEKITNSNYLRFGRVKSCGCMISAGEAETEALLNQKGVKHTRQYLFPDLVSDSGNYLMFDFAIKDDDDSLICLIEYQGVQHYDPDMDFGKQQREVTDAQKKEYCKTHNIKLFEIRYDEEIEPSLDSILKEIGY